jgi:predicted dehydrogenase
MGIIGEMHYNVLTNIIKNELIYNKHKVKVKILGVADTDNKKISKIKRKYSDNIELITNNPVELINNKSIDAIYIATPTKNHKNQYIQAAEAGKHIFCEKPLAFNLKDIEKMINVKRKNDTLVQTGLVLRHCPVFWKLKRIFEEHKWEFGKELAFIFRDDQEWPIGTREHPSKWRKDPDLAHAGCLYEHSIHDVDLLEYFFGDDAKLSKLFAKIKYVSPITKNILEDSAILNLEYNNDIAGSLVSVWHMAPRDERRFEIFFENGWILLDKYKLISFNKFEYHLPKSKNKFHFDDLVKEYLKEIGYEGIPAVMGGYFFENLSFIESIIREDEPSPSLEIGYNAHKIIENAYKSSKENKIINME